MWVCGGGVGLWWVEIASFGVCVYRSIFGFFCGFGGCGGGDGGCGGVLVAMGLVFDFFFFFCGFGGYGGDDGVCGGGLGFLFVCGFGCNYGLWLKWRFGSCGCGCHSFGGCGCVGWWFFFFLTLGSG